MKNKKTVTIFDGRQFKTVAFESTEDWIAWIEGKDSSKDPYVRAAYYFAVVNRRAAGVQSIPRMLLGKGGKEIEEKELPFTFERNLGSLLYRSSISLDRRGAAYWGKIGAGSMLSRVRWLDARTIEPIYDNQGAGLLYFQRSVGGRQIRFPYDEKTYSSPDLGWVWRLDENEAGPGMPPEEVAKRPANILAGVDQLVDDLFERGGIAQHWITADFNPGKEEKERLLAKITRTLFRGLDSAFGVEIFSDKLRVDKIGTDPKDLELPHLDESNQVDISAVLGTPRLIINPDSAANRSMLDRTWSSWVDFTIMPHAQMIVDEMNSHILEPQGYSLDLNPHALTISQEEERQRAQAWMLYVSQGADPAVAAAMLGLDIPEGMELMLDEPPITVQTPKITPEQEEQEDARGEGDESDFDKFVELTRLRHYIKHGNHLKRPFYSDILTQADIDREVGKAQDVPFPGDWESYP